MTKNRPWHQSEYQRPLRKDVILLGWFILVVSVVLISSISMMSVMAPPSGGHFDKVLHVTAYAVLTFGVVFALPRRSLIALFIAVFVFGVIIEYLQGAMGQGRTASWADAIANGIGALLVMLSWRWICPRLKE